MKLLGAGFAVSSAGCVGSTTKANEFQDELSTAEQAASDYTDPKTALEDGFKIGGPYVPGMGWHFSHPKRLEEAAKNGLSIEKPPILTYVETEDGLKLGSVEYAAPTKALSEDPDLFSDENADATEEWHTHEAATHVFAVPDGGAQKPSEIPFEEWVTNDNWAEFSPPDDSLEPGEEIALNWGTPKAKKGDKSKRVIDLATTHPGLRTLHVWVNVENPDGVFSPVNPEFSDGGHDH